MTNELSKQICEICGIKPKCDYELTMDNKSKTIKFNKHKVCYSYPDFGEPENFCKLINLIYKCGINQPCDYQLATLAEDDDFFTESINYSQFQDRYLELLLYILSKECGYWEKRKSEKIKQSIREAEWKYE